MAAPACATSFTDPRRSRRAISESCKLDGIASGGSGPVKDEAIGLFPEHTRFNDRLGQLFDEQRNTVGLADDLPENVVGQWLTPRTTRTIAAQSSLPSG